MKKFYSVVSGFLVFLFLLSPIRTYAEVTADEAEYRILLLQIIELLQQQISGLQAGLNKRTGQIDQTRQNKSVVYENGKLSELVAVLDIYPVTPSDTVGYIRDPEQREYFEQVFSIFPTEYDKRISRVAVFDGADTEFDAYVETLPPNHKEWLFGASEEVIEDYDESSNTELIIHELAHIISYEEISNVAKSSQVDCHSYFKHSSCPVSNSYLSQFIDDFWSDADLERAELFAEVHDSSNRVYEYYKDNETDFVTDYAATSPEEDFAESFMFFVTGASTDGSVANQKIDFFAQSPKLLSVRAEIISNK